MPLLNALLSGLIFGAGLLLSGMANPAKVLGFLDVAGAWDPSLMLVMIGAIAVAFLPFRFARTRTKSWLGEAMSLPRRQQIDRRLLLGSALFGIGWGIAGFCPGPGLLSIGLGLPQGLLFVLAMLAGMALFEVIERARAAKPSPPTSR
ncbi:YeeE/YedE family protein [Rhodocyclus tenuis]|uniref:YeeE/YedE family protein n=2 Tax=Rhodocyclus TaxID=1064 RepID=A0A6L5JTY2_RHOTE|nr:YeeE/YedE family protein [Rhodocyclus gracilis]MQY50853.1 YeeE/YedE family protein [Rhodocyclus gracilis]MRD72826.1 YeeE/YedE family protein [Rhodocyclus gracilis]NJA90032.1 YeeE/YedE family protein [Rhodocyclus gracilis]